MKRLMFLCLAALAALFAILIATDVINFQTDRTDRWAMIFGFAGVAFFIGLASADSSSTTDPDTAQAAPRATRPTPRTAAADSPSTPPRPMGPAHRRAMAGDPDAAAPLPQRAGAPFAEYADLVPAGGKEPTPETATIDLVALEAEPAPTVDDDPETHEVSDDEQIDEITALIERATEDENDATLDQVDPPVRDDVVTLDAASGSSEIDRLADQAQPLARLDLRLADYDDEALRRVVKESEGLVIAEMVRTGQLTSAGELTERDIASMVFLSYTSEEMLAELRLRKALDDSERDQPGDVALTERALAPLKNME